MAGAFDSFGEWHRLFDALCIERGHLDNATLASDYCALTKNKASTAYESSLKSLNNWRQGLHTPSRRNFRILTLMLRIEDAPEVLPHWNRLYEEAQRRKPADGNGDASQPATTPETDPAPTAASGGRTSRRLFAAAVFLLLGAGGSVLALGTFDRPQTHAAAFSKAGPQVIDMTGQRIEAHELVIAKVGQSVVVHGSRGRCGEQPPGWEEVLQGLPQLSNGFWSDGGVGIRVSRACSGGTPARAVVFTATHPGQERFTLYDDPITIRVTE
ncbi:hypothetical protein H2509_00745 [Stappia sp. F7233]|uniref:Uncharacterized protein n=1 Tax=Stappia albiluteola TaxID=2758565 RepID=A0A839A8U9_9HYPH|nr:hypothetical protein [Stappia albiluteola]MBA5775646.1 hypothetical protein [Stappia albiluteola]